MGEEEMTGVVVGYKQTGRWVRIVEDGVVSQAMFQSIPEAQRAYVEHRRDKLKENK